MSTTALLVIDVQNALVEAQPHQPEQLLANISSLIERARVADVPVVYVQHGSPPQGPLAPGTRSWQLHPAIGPSAGELIVQKQHPDAFQATNLQDELTRLGVQHLILTGMQSDFCVDTTCRRAYSLGYTVTLVQDAHSTFDTPTLPAAQIVAHHNGVLGNWFALLQPTRDVEF